MASVPVDTISEKSFNSEKIRRYEYFLNDVLKTDLRVALERRDELFTQIAEHLELQRMLEKVIAPENNTRQCMRTKVDIGCNFYVQADIEDLSTIVVDIGCGLWLPMSPQEAKSFCENKIAFLNKKVDCLTKDELSLKAHINIVVAALQEMQSL